MLYYIYGWSKIKVNKTLKNNKPSVSIVIAARNEEKFIGNTIKSILHQNYPNEKFELIVVDDHSEDSTVAEIKKIKSKNLRFLSLAKYPELNIENLAFKKQALAYGIESSKNEIIVFTDADCLVPINWLLQITNPFVNQSVKIVAGPVSFTNEPSFLNKFQQMDFCGMILITGAAIQTGLHLLANGANLAVRKTAFQEVGGYRDTMSRASGDDLFIMEKILKRWPGSASFVKSSEAIVATNAATNFKSFVQQRLRWASKNGDYSDFKTKFILGLVYLFHLSLLITIILGLVDFSKFGFYMLTLLASKLSADFILMYNATKFFGRSKLLWLFLPAALFHVFYIVSIGAFGPFIKYNWKGRKLN